MSDLLPAVTESLDIGDVNKRWKRVWFKKTVGEAPNCYYPTLTIGCGELPPDHPDHDNILASAFIDLRSNEEIITRPRYTIYVTGDALIFMGYNPPDYGGVSLLELNVNAENMGFGQNLVPIGSLDLGKNIQFHQLENDWRDISQFGYHFLGDIARRGVSLPTPSAKYRLTGIGERDSARTKDEYKICYKRDTAYVWKDVLSNKIAVNGKWTVSGGNLQSDDTDIMTVNGNVYYNTATEELEVD